LSVTFLNTTQHESLMMRIYRVRVFLALASLLVV
jgi:hypothetical protein